jgi:heat-inducible transcriptional repressor
MDPNGRSKRVLAALVREYISSGEPVASSLLVTAAGLGVSSATVRNILARLEEEGYVQQPHTSAGRIPTDRGYRFYVDMLLESKRTSRAATAVEARLRRDNPGRLIDSLLPQVSHVLSQASRTIGFAIRPAHEAAVFDRVEFIPLSGMRVLVVIVARGGHVIQKAIDVDEMLGADDLRQAANYLNEEFSGLPLPTLQALLLMIEQKQRLVRLLNEYIDGPGLTVVIGAEHLDPNLRPFSLIASTYEDGSGTGTIGVIGPTRMRYSRAIAVVDGAAQAVSRVLRDPN